MPGHTKHVYDVDIYQPCSATGTYTLNTDGGGTAFPYAINSGSVTTNPKWNCTYTKPGLFTGTYWDVGVSTPYAVTEYSWVSTCECSTGTATKIGFRVLKSADAEILSYTGVCDTSNPCPTSSAAASRVSFTFAGWGCRTCNWDLYKPADSGPTKYDWGTVTVHTATTGLDNTQCLASSRVVFTEIT